MDSVSHGYKKGDKLLVQAGFGATVVTYLGYSEINWDYFICELENGDISDEWKWDEVIRKLDADEIKKHEELLGIKPETKTEIIRCKDCKWFGKREKQKENTEIHVGDEVILNANSSFDANTKAIVIMNDNSEVYPYNVMVANGYTEWVDRDEIDGKTGRTFPEIAEVLKKIQEGE